MMNILHPRRLLDLTKPVHNLLRNLNPAFTASIPNILGQKQILGPIENVQHYRSISVAPSLLRAVNSAPKVEDDSNINISKVAKYREVFKMSNSDSILDQCVRAAFKEDIRVPKVCVEVTRASVISWKHGRKHNSLKYPSVSANHFTPLETQIIQINAERIRAKLTENKEDFYQDLFLDQSERSSDKENIVGHFLSQGLEDARHPGDVFHQLKVETFYKKGPFTDDENIKIMEAVKENGDTSGTFRDLEKELWRRDTNIRERYRDILKHQDKTSSGTFSIEESLKILQAVHDKVPNFLEDGESVSAVVWGEELAAEMNRKPLYIAKHWKHVLFPLLTRHEAGVLEVDFRLRIVKHCADNGIRYAQEADWAAITSLPQFRGTTATSLAHTYGLVRGRYKEKEKENGNKVRDAEVTSEVLLDYLLTRGKGRKPISKREMSIIEFYKTLK